VCHHPTHFSDFNKVPHGTTSQHMNVSALALLRQQGHEAFQQLSIGTPPKDSSLFFAKYHMGA
jgi:hypothetical protein